MQTQSLGRTHQSQDSDKGLDRVDSTAGCRESEEGSVFS